MTFGLSMSEEFKPYIKLKGFREVLKKDQELTRAKAKPELKPEDCEETKMEMKRVEKKEIKENIKEKR